MEDYKKKYDELLLKLQKAKVDDNVCDEMYYRVIDNIVPELKESEDEKIRNVLVDYFKKYKEQEECGIKTFFGIPTDNIIAWLKKKGEQKPQGKSALEAIKEEKVDMEVLQAY